MLNRDDDELCQVIERDLPDLIAKLEAILAHSPPDNPPANTRTS